MYEYIMPHSLQCTTTQQTQCQFHSKKQVHLSEVSYYRGSKLKSRDKYDLHNGNSKNNKKNHTCETKAEITSFQFQAPTNLNFLIWLT